MPPTTEITSEINQLHTFPEVYERSPIGVRGLCVVCVSDRPLGALCFCPVGVV